MQKTKWGCSPLRSLTGLMTALAVTVTAVQAKPYHAKITAQKANATVIKRFGGHLASKTELEKEEGKWQYAVSVQSGRKLREVMVDANTGKIVDVEITTAAQEHIEHVAEMKLHNSPLKKFN